MEVNLKKDNVGIPAAVKRQAVSVYLVKKYKRNKRGEVTFPSISSKTSFADSVRPSLAAM